MMMRLLFNTVKNLHTHNILIFIFIFNLCLCQNNVNDYIKQNSDDLIFTSNIIFTFSHRSKLACSVTCTLHSACVAFTFTKFVNSTLGECQGYERYLDIGSTVQSEGSKTYLRPGELDG